MGDIIKEIPFIGDALGDDDEETQWRTEGPVPGQPQNAQQERFGPPPPPARRFGEVGPRPSFQGPRIAPQGASKLPAAIKTMRFG